MFGLIYALVTGVSYTVSGIKMGHKNHMAKQEGLDRKNKGLNPENMYYDRKGIGRDLFTNDFVSRENDKLTGDIWIKKGEPAVRVRNISEEWRMRFYEKMKANPEKGRTVVNDIYIDGLQDENTMKWSGIPWKNEYYCKGQWFKDLETGRLFVIRTCKYQNDDDSISLLPMHYSADFYMDIETRHLIRPSDDFITANEVADPVIKVPEEILSKIITEWNREIDKGTTDEWKHKFLGDSKYYWYAYYFNDKDGYSKRSREEKQMMNRCEPFNLA